MKKLLAFLLTITTCVVFLPFRISAQSQEKLTNQSIIELVKGGFPDEIIIAKIKSSATAFDTSLSALQELRNNKVNDAIIVVMVEISAPPNKTSQEFEITIPDGTAIEIALRNDLSGQTAKVGDEVTFVVVRDIKVDGITVVEHESFAVGKVITAEKARYWGRKGLLGWEMKSIITVSGNKIPIRAVKSVEGEGKRAQVAVAAVLTSVLFFSPVGLAWGLKKGESAYVPAGTFYLVYVNGETKIKVKQ